MGYCGVGGEAMILVATPARLSTPRALLARCEQLVHSFCSPMPIEWRLYLNEQPWSSRKYEPNARARNELIGRFLRPWHTHVLWLDVDIIFAPENLISVLLGVVAGRGGENGNAIAAPMVWVERVTSEEDRPPASIATGGWFYDTGGFQKLDGEFADFHEGVGGNEEETEMLSVGCVYLAPAELYRQGLHYRPEGDEVEHLSFMRDARAAGVTVWATRQANVIHAYLPKWGDAWHSS